MSYSASYRLLAAVQNTEAHLRRNYMLLSNNLLQMLNRAEVFLCLEHLV
jgi:hypothetical protein